MLVYVAWVGQAIASARSPHDVETHIIGTCLSPSLNSDRLIKRVAHL